MSSPLFIHLVSTDHDFLQRLRSRLAGKMECCIFRTAAECQTALANHRPDLLLIDLAMPSDEGFTLHRALRDDFDFSDLYQLLLCPPEMLGREGFEPDDFLMQPLPDDVIEYKLGLLAKVFEARANTRTQMAYAQHVAFTSMSAMGELGVVMQFLSKSFACQNVQSVASLAVEALRQYELEGAVYLIWEGDHHALTTSGNALSAEKETLIAQRRTLGRLLEIERNLVVNFEHVSVLITNLPENDAERLGRIRDNIATLAEGVESRVQGLLLEYDNLLKQQGIRYAVNEISDSVADLHSRQMIDLMQTRALVNHVIDDFEAAFLHMAVHTEHENQMIGDLVELRHKIGEIVSHPGEVHHKLQIVVGALQTLAGEIEQRH